MSKAHADWPALVAESQTHGVAATARRHGVNPKTLRWWKWRLAHTQQAAPIELVPITVVTAPQEVATITCGAVRVTVHVADAELIAGVARRLGC